MELRIVIAVIPSSIHSWSPAIGQSERESPGLQYELQLPAISVTVMKRPATGVLQYDLLDNILFRDAGQLSLFEHMPVD